MDTPLSASNSITRKRRWSGYGQHFKKKEPPSEQTIQNFKETVEFISSLDHLTKIDLAKQPFYSPKLPGYIFRIIAENRLFDILDQNEAAKIFIQAVEQRRMRGKRIVSIFNTVKPLIFATTTIKPATVHFDRKKPAQVRLPQMKKIEALVSFVVSLEDNNKYKWPILVTFYTGLRSAEVLSMKASTVHELVARATTVNIMRKNGTLWKPIYYWQFTEFVGKLKEHFNEELEHSVDSKLFDFTARALHYFIRQYYIMATHEESVLGFGMHAFRYFIASRLLENGDMSLAQQFLGHKCLASTAHYLKLDDNCFRKKYDQINRNEDLYKSLMHVGGGEATVDEDVEMQPLESLF